MDSPCNYQEYRTVLRDLAAVNRLMRGYKPTLAFLDRITAGILEHRDTSQPLRILDVGSGGGDTLRAVARWASDRKLFVELTGIDLNPHSTSAAEEFSADDPHAHNIHFHTADVFSYSPDFRPDIILSALFAHHLSSPEIVRFLSWMEQHARLGWYINDLHRSRRAAFWFRFLPVIFRWHRFIANDGPVSLRRAFVPEDWLRMLSEAHISSATIEQHAMNRLCVARIR
jgi:SAM-dependent methyltransferase